MPLLSDPSFLKDATAVAARTPEVPAADFDDGVNAAASCAPGIGLNEGQPNLVGEPQQFTLNDQNGAARTPQNSQIIAGTPAALRFGTNPVAADGKIVQTGNATLASLAAGWVAV